MGVLYFSVGSVCSVSNRHSLRYEHKVNLPPAALEKRTVNSTSKRETNTLDADLFVECP